jgi:hypothetical protein
VQIGSDHDSHGLLRPLSLRQLALLLTAQA